MYDNLDHSEFKLVSIIDYCYVKFLKSYLQSPKQPEHGWKPQRKKNSAFMYTINWIKYSERERKNPRLNCRLNLDLYH